MIPKFLLALSALIRKLLAEGRAIHVTEDTARELELLAGLPWGECPPTRVNLHTAPGGQVIYREPMAGVHPADLALGWPMASRASPGMRFGKFGPEEEWSEANAKRAAECAELAFMSMVLLPGLGEIRNDDLPAGTRDGARAAWGFIVERLTSDVRPKIFDGPAGPVLGVMSGPIQPFEQARIDKYRRELEGMKC